MFQGPFECVPLTISYRQFQSKECYCMFACTFLAFAVVFVVLFVVVQQNICVFIIFISFFDKVSNFRNRILTNQTPELVIKICQWNSCQIFSENLLLVTLIICSAKAYVFKMRIFPLKIFTQTTLSLAEFELGAS